MPLFTVVFMIATLASVGLPGMSGFVGEFLVLLGAFSSLSLSSAQVFAAIGATGVILGAVYMLWMVQRVFFGPVTHEENRSLKDLSTREVAVLLPLVILIFWMGLYPKPWLSRMEPAIDQMLRQHEQVVSAPAVPESELAVFDASTEEVRP
jgi:NADH-quinone oxidoreductase subunit M